MSSDEPRTLLIKEGRDRRERGGPLVPTLTMLEGPEVGAFFPFDAGRRAHRIGRAEDADMRIDSASVSRYHALFVVASHDGHRAVRIEDTGSTNGVLVNGRSCKESWLISGDKVRMGDILLRFEWMSEEEVRYHSEVSERIRAAQRDHLTGLLSRAFVESRMPQLAEELERRSRQAVVLLLDLDRFKSINDRHGHLVGDQVIARVARAVAGALRRSDYAVRWGGEEILVLMPDADADQGVEVATRLRLLVQGMELDDLVPELRVTISAGLARRRRGESAQEWFERADKALYGAKGGGRNRVVLSEDPAGSLAPSGEKAADVTAPVESLGEDEPPGVD